MTPIMLAAVLPQLRAMLAELTKRPGVPSEVVDTATKFFAALERWAAQPGD